MHLTAFSGIRCSILSGRRHLNCYLSPIAPITTPLSCFFGDFSISSAGVQQGDPLALLLICLAIRDIVVSLKSSFNVFYLNNGTLGGPVSDVKSDLAFLESAAHKIGLFLNHDKSEIICVDEPSKRSMLSSFPFLRMVDSAKATLLGSPFGGDESLNMCWESKVEQLETIGSQLKQLQAHDALCHLRNALAVPKVLYILRTAPKFQIPGPDCL